MHQPEFCGRRRGGITFDDVSLFKIKQMRKDIALGGP